MIKVKLLIHIFFLKITKTCICRVAQKVKAMLFINVTRPGALLSSKILQYIDFINKRRYVFSETLTPFFANFFFIYKHRYVLVYSILNTVDLQYWVYSIEWVKKGGKSIPDNNLLNNNVNTVVEYQMHRLILSCFLGIPWKQMTVLTDAFDIQLLYSCNVPYVVIFKDKRMGILSQDIRVVW